MKPHALTWILVALAMLLGRPDSSTAQLSHPCEAACSLVLGLTGVTVATSTLVAWGRHTGGISNTRQGMAAWGTGFALTVGGGIALSGSGARQERAVYAAGLGVLAGAAAGWVVGSIRPGEDRANRWATTLIGAGVGALIGGVYGAVSHDEGSGGMGAPVPLFTVRFEP